MERYQTPDTYAVWSKNENIRYKSTSGGAFSEFANVILLNGGLVVGAQYNDDNLVEHCIVDNVEDLKKIRQSKYLSSSLGDIYRTIKEKLEKDILIGFCGSPCQVAGLYSFLGKEYDNLFTMDFICRGMNSPKAFKAWIDEIERKEQSRVVKVWFKYKDGGWKTSPKRTRLDFENGLYRIYENEDNLYMHGYLTANLFIRPCCGSCQFKGLPRKSDVTLADFWGIEEKLDDDKGTSLLLVNSEKGCKFFELASKNMAIYKKNFDDIFKGNPMYSASVNVPQNGHEFLESLDNMNFSTAIKKYTPKESISHKILRKMKQFIKKMCKENGR